MTQYREQIEAAANAVQIQSPTGYSWFGKASEKLPASITRNLNDQTARSILLYALHMKLYRDFYTRGFASPEVREAGQAIADLGPGGFVQSLEESNSGRGHWENGWTCLEQQDDARLVEKDGLTLWALEAHCRVTDKGGKTDNVKLRLPKGLLAMSPGYYLALGDAPFVNAAPDLRIYWNLHASGAAKLLEIATERLNGAGIPFRLKVLNEPSRYNRCDSGVLYVSQGDFPRLELEQIYRALEGHLKSDVPAFTKLLAPGCALAEDPGNGNSFGLHRCELMAKGLIHAFESGATTLEKRTAAVLDAFSTAGLSCDQPFLNANSEDRYPFRHTAKEPAKAQPRKAVEAPPKVSAQSLLETAEAIGRRISQQAVRHEGLCNWVGAVAPAKDQGAVTASYKALGPDLYGGTAGIALFLSELHRATGSAEYRELALRSIRHALTYADIIAPKERLSLHLGWIGIAYAATYVGHQLDEPSLITSARALLARDWADVADERENDLLAGRAGSIAGLLALHRLLGDEQLLDRAGQLGQELLSKAEGDPETGLSWPSPLFPKQPNLLGFSHGVSGIACALAELWQATGRDAYRDTALQGFAYERRWYQNKDQNWPDLRELKRGTCCNAGSLPTTTFWCHGATGVALARLRCAELLNDPRLMEEAAVALSTTKRVTEDWLRGTRGDFSLCHGLAGNADSLLQAARQDRGFEKYLQTVDAVTAMGSSAHGHSDRAWPCGTGTGETPALMLGLAGIGQLYLRSLDPDLPSVLLLEPEAIGARLLT